MNRQIISRIDQVRIYLDRVRRDVALKNPVQGMADAAELGYQAQRLWKLFFELCQDIEQPKPLLQSGCNDPGLDCFCNAKPFLATEVLHTEPEIRSYRVFCQKCGAGTGFFDSVDAAIARWTVRFSRSGFENERR
jgi:hypothetical protein